MMMYCETVKPAALLQVISVPCSRNLYGEPLLQLYANGGRALLQAAEEAIAALLKQWIKQWLKQWLKHWLGLRGIADDGPLVEMLDAIASEVQAAASSYTSTKRRLVRVAKSSPSPPPPLYGDDSAAAHSSGPLVAS